MEKLTSSDASDALLELGSLGLLPGIHRVATSKSIAGRAVTLYIVKGNKSGIPLREGIMAACSKQSEDAILLIKCGFTDYSIFGSVLGSIAKSRKVGGIIVDGSVRDVDELAALELPVFARTVNPFSKPKELSVVSVGKIVHINSVSVESGDLIVADGVVVVPDSLIGKVTQHVSGLKDKDRDFLKSLRHP